MYCACRLLVIDQERGDDNAKGCQRYRNDKSVVESQHGSGPRGGTAERGPVVQKTVAQRRSQYGDAKAGGDLLAGVEDGGRPAGIFGADGCEKPPPGAG